MVAGKDPQQRRHCVGKRNMVRQVRDTPRAHRWDKKWCNEDENDPKTGAHETLRNPIVARDLIPNAPRRGRRKRHPTPAPVLPEVHGDPTDDKSSSSSDSTSSSTSTQAQGEIPKHVTVRAQAQTASRSQQQTTMGAHVPVVPAASVLPAATTKLHSRSSTPTKRPAESMTLDVPSQAKHPGGEDSQVDVRSVTVAGVAVSGTEDEDPAEYFVHHEDARELQDPLVDNAETEGAMKVKLKVLDRLAEFGVYETVDLHVALGKKEVTTHWHTDHSKDGIIARVVARELKGDETMYDAFAPCSAPSTGRIINYLSLKKSYRTFTADVTNAYFLVDEDEGAARCIGNPTSVSWKLRKQLYGQRRAGTRLVDFMAECHEEQSFDRCEAARQSFLNYALDGSVEVHMDDLHGTGPNLALDLVRINLSLTIRFKVRAVYDMA